jgi:PhoH-like ATPase
MMSEIEKGNLDKIVIMSNPIAVRGAAKLGFYPGDKDTKLLDSQIGNFLNTKLGGNLIVE